MKRLENHYEKTSAGMNKNGEKSGDIPVMNWIVDHGGRSFAGLLEGKGIPRKESLSRAIPGISGK